MKRQQKQKSFLKAEKAFRSEDWVSLRMEFFIVLDSENNELLVKSAKGWVGKTKGLKEVVAFYKDKVYFFG